MHAAEWMILVVVVLGVVTAVFGWDRYRGNQKVAGTGSGPTSEVFADPVTGQRMRVWYDPATGKREYRAESKIRGAEGESDGS